MAGFKKGGIEELRVTIGKIAKACMELDGISEENLKHTEIIMEALETLCESHLKKPVDAKTEFLRSFLNGEE